MPTINQLVRKPRKSKVEKSDSPALNKGYNSFKKTQTNVNSPQNVEFVHVGYDDT